MQMAPRLAVLVLGGLVSAAAWAGEIPSRFSLGNYIPGDAWLYLHEARTSDRDWIDAEWNTVFEALE